LHIFKNGYQQNRSPLQPSALQTEITFKKIHLFLSVNFESPRAKTAKLPFAAFDHNHNVP